MKNTFYVFVVIVISFFYVSCGNTEKTDTNNTSSNEQTTENIEESDKVIELTDVGFVGILLENASHYVKDNICLTVIMKDSVNEAQVLQLQKELNNKEYTKFTEYVTHEDAAEDMKEYLEADFVEFLGYIPIPPSIKVYLKADYTSVEQIQTIETELMQKGTVKQIFYQKELIHLINTK